MSSSSNDKRSGAGTLLFQSVRCDGLRKYSLQYSYNIFSATPVYSFVDYLRGGCGLSVMVAVDFTVRIFFFN